MRLRPIGIVRIITCFLDLPQIPDIHARRSHLTSFRIAVFLPTKQRLFALSPSAFEIVIIEQAVPPALRLAALATKQGLYVSTAIPVRHSTIRQNYHSVIGGMFAAPFLLSHLVLVFQFILDLEGPHVLVEQVEERHHLEED